MVDCCNLGWIFCLQSGDGWGYWDRGIGQSFHVSNRFSDADPEIGQGILCLGGTLGISSSGGGLDPSFQGLVVQCGTSANCPIANLYTITGIDSAMDLTNGVWVLTVVTVGVGAVEVGVEGVGWVSNLTLYLLLVIMVLFLSSLALGPGASLIMGVGDWLSWSLLALLQMGLGLGPGLWTKFPF